LLRILPIVVALFTIACGYHVAGRVNSLPKAIQVFAVPPFDNQTNTPRISQSITAAVSRQLLTRTHYRVQPQVDGSDAVLHGVVTAVATLPVTFDPVTGRVSMFEMTVRVKTVVNDTRTNKELYRNDDMVFHEQYQVSQDARTFFEEDQVAYERLSRTVASTLVASILEQF
jgi:hypothetical protein